MFIRREIRPKDRPGLVKMNIVVPITKSCNFALDVNFNLHLFSTFSLGKPVFVSDFNVIWAVVFHTVKSNFIREVFPSYLVLSPLWNLHKESNLSGLLCAGHAL